MLRVLLIAVMLAFSGLPPALADTMTPAAAIPRLDLKKAQPQAPQPPADLDPISPPPEEASGAAAPGVPGAPAAVASDDDFITPLQGPVERIRLKTIAKAYAHYASPNGCSHFAWGTITDNGAVFTLKYLKPDETLQNWTRMVVVKVYALTGVRKRDTAAIGQAISMLEGQYMNAARVTSQQEYRSEAGERMMFMEYAMGANTGMVYGASAYKRTGTATAAFIQLLMRLPIPPDEALKIHQIVNISATLPEKPKDQP